MEFLTELTPSTERASSTVLSDAWLRRLVMLAIILLVLHAVGAWSYSVLGSGAAVAAALLVGTVSVFSARMAGSGNRAWFVVPTLVFTALPLAGRLWTLAHSEQSWWSCTMELAPFLIGFAAPVLLLLGAHLELASRAARLP
jgi:hypothetical protein